VARILALVEELMLASRVEGALRAAGHEVTLASPPGPDQAFDLIVCDLDVTDPETLSARPEPAIGFYSHVDVETRERAVASGMDLVIPRSRMSRELPKLVERLLGDREQRT
jgi:hypothetical protein